jgi:hypothetical protein
MPSRLAACHYYDRRMAIVRGSKKKKEAGPPVMKVDSSVRTPGHRQISRSSPGMVDPPTTSYGGPPTISGEKSTTAPLSLKKRRCLAVKNQS